MEFEFLDFVSKAKELGLTEPTFRARVLSHYEELPCFIYVSGAYARGEQDEFLPAWSEDKFPFCNWEDHGSPLGERGLSAIEATRLRRPRYYVSGWVAIGIHDFSEIFFKGKIIVNAATIYVVSSDLREAIPLQLNIKSEEEWVESAGYEQGGYYRDLMTLITKDKLYWISRGLDDSKPLSPRKENSYLSIIAAMRALLMDEEGGNFPSQAKVIDELVRRYGRADGISKRNLETVFVAATRSAGELKPKE